MRNRARITDSKRDLTTRASQLLHNSLQSVRARRQIDQRRRGEAMCVVRRSRREMTGASLRPRSGDLLRASEADRPHRARRGPIRASSPVTRHERPFGAHKTPSKRRCPPREWRSSGERLAARLRVSRGEGPARRPSLLIASPVPRRKRASPSNPLESVENCQKSWRSANFAVKPP